MQTGLVLPSHQTPLPQIGAGTPLAPEGALDSAFEVELPVAEGPLGPPVMLAMPVSPVILGATTAAAVEAPAAGTAGAMDASLAAATGTGAETTDRVDQTLPEQGASAKGGKPDAPPVHPIAEPRPGDGQGDIASGTRSARAAETALRDAGPADAGLANRSMVAAAAWTATRPAGDAEGQVGSTVSDAVRMAAPDRAEGRGEAGIGGIGGMGHAGPATPEASDQATAPLRQGTKPETAPALPLAPEGGAEMPAPGPTLPKAAPPSEAPVDAGSPAPQVTRMQGEGGAPDGRGSADVPGSTDARVTTPALPEAERPPQESQPRPGLWESMFSSLALPLSAAGEMARALRPVLTVGAVAVPQPAQVGDQASLATPDEPRAALREPEAMLTAAAPPTSGVPKTVAPASASAVALWPQGAAWTMAAVEADRMTGDEGLQTLVAPGTMAAAGAAAGPSAIPTTPSGPVPHLAARMTAALRQSADGATELALSPDELGRVRLRLEPDAANPDRMVVMITFERPETLDLFRRHAGELAEALRDAGYAGADIGFGQDQSGSDGSDGSQGRSADWAAGPAQTDPAAAPSPAPSPAPRLAAGASLDLRL